MFFPERVVSVKPKDVVLEVGPGGSPHPRSDVFLEMAFECDLEAEKQRSGNSPLQTEKQVVYYDGENFPFEDNQFDYVICSHVLEHVPNFEKFVAELQRVSKKGYLEFPTIYYDYLYNNYGHINFVMKKDDVLLYLPINETSLDQFSVVQEFFQKGLNLRYTGAIKDFKNYFFQGFEWFDEIQCRKACNVAEISYDMRTLKLEPYAKKKRKKFFGLF